MIGFSELTLILLVVLIIFGAGKLPQVMGDLGKGMNEFKKGMKDEPSTTVKETTPAASDTPKADV